MSDPGDSMGEDFGAQSFFDSAPRASGGAPEGPGGWAGIINPDYRNAPVFTDAQLDQLQGSPFMTALGIDLTDAPPDFLAGTGLTPSHDQFDFGHYSDIAGRKSLFGDSPAPVAGSSGGVSDLVYRPVLGQSKPPLTPLPNAPSDDPLVMENFAGKGQDSIPKMGLSDDSRLQPPADQRLMVPQTADLDAGANANNEVVVTSRNAPSVSDRQIASTGGTGGTPTAAGTDAAHARQLAILKAILTAPGAEGRRNDVYLDSLGIPTVGIGHKGLPGDNLKKGDVISDERVDQLFQQDGSKALVGARAQAAKAGISDPDFIPNLASVNLQLGTGWTAKFPHTWQMIKNGQYEDAAQALHGTKWEKQTPNRVKAFQKALRGLTPKPSS